MTIESENKDLSILDLDKISPEEEYTSDQGRLGDKKLALDRRKVEADLQKSMQRRAQGAVGRLLEDRDHAPTNAVGLSLLLMVIVSATLAFIGYEDTIGFVDLAKGVIIGVFGYFAGARTVGRNRSPV